LQVSSKHRGNAGCFDTGPAWNREILTNSILLEKILFVSYYNRLLCKNLSCRQREGDYGEPEDGEFFH